jgi:hypothetical protein
LRQTHKAAKLKSLAALALPLSLRNSNRRNSFGRLARLGNIASRIKHEVRSVYALCFRGWQHFELVLPNLGVGAVDVHPKVSHFVQPLSATLGRG